MLIADRGRVSGSVAIHEEYFGRWLLWIARWGMGLEGWKMAL